MSLATAERKPLAQRGGSALRAPGFGLRKLSVRLLLLVLLAAVPVFAVQIYHEVQQREQRRAEVGQQVEQIAELVAAQLDRVIEGAETLMATLGETPAIRAHSTDSCREGLIRLIARFPHLNVIRVADADGQVFCTSGSEDEPVNFADRPYFQRALETERAAVSELFRREPDGRQVIAIAQPTLDDDKRVQNVLVLLLDPGQISALLAQVPLPEGAVIGILDRSGQLVARVPYVGERIGEPVLDDKFVAALFGPREGNVAREGEDGVRRFYGFARSGEASNLVAFVGLAEAPIFAEADRLFRRQFVLSAAAFLVAAMIAYAFGDYAVRRPIMKLRTAIDRMGTGDLSARADVDSGIEELSALAASFDEMARKRRQAEEQQKVIMRELSHRMKNGLAAVRSIAAQTLRYSTDLKEFHRAFEGRLAALSRTSTLLTDGWSATDLRSLVEAVVEPWRTHANVRLSGPPAQLPSNAALTLSMTLHELATNAAKYGALSTPEGRVEITWRLEAEPEGERLVMDWSESGGPPVAVPERRGFGRTLIEQSVQYELDGRADLEFAPAGVRCRIEIPLRPQEAPA